MQCPRCQHENPPGSKFCLECGAKLGLKCVACGVELPSGAKFCNECGHPIGASSAPAGVGKLTGPDAYLPKHLAEKTLTSKAALEGERKQVTVLFADLKGSMELLADRDPEEARALLDPVLQLMMDSVHRYEGTVNQVMGDGIMALFGAPLAQEDHAVRASYAALGMHEAVARHVERAQRAGGVPVQIRVGLNSGEVVVRSISSDLRMDYSAVGETTHLAARMEQLARPGTTLLTRDTLQLAEGFVQVRALGPVPVKGLSAPVEVFELAGVGTARSRLQAAAAVRGFTRFVGRDAEMAVLRQIIERAGTGHGQIVAVVGEPGVGKSRFCWEFTHSHRTQRWLVLEVGSASHATSTPYQPVGDLLRAYFAIADRDDHRAIREKVAGKVLMLDRTLEPLLPPLLTVLDVPVEDTAWQALEPLQRRRSILDAARRLLLRESQVQPVLLLVEDLHWLDEASQAVLEALVESLPAAAILLLVNYRPEYTHRWGALGYYAQLRLDPLPTESAHELARALLGNDPGLDPLEGHLITVTEGNPLFLEESVRTLVETGALAGERGAYRLARPVDNLGVPATVHAVLAARIDRLAPEDKALLQAASVIGKDVPFSLLLAVVDMPEEGLRQGLGRLQAAEFLYEAALFPDIEYTFKHALTQAVAYGGLLHERRRALHARIVAAIRALSGDRLSKQLEALAHHAVRAELWTDAVGLLREAADRAAARSAYHEATARLEEALRALAHVPAGPATTTEGIDIRLQLDTVLMALADYQRLLRYAHEAQALAEAAGDRLRAGRALTSLTTVLRMTGQHASAIEAGERAVDITRDAGSAAEHALAAYRLAQAHTAEGDFRRAAGILESLIVSPGSGATTDSSELAAYVRVIAPASAWLARTLAALGRFSEALHHGREAVRLAERDGRPYALIGALRGLGVALVAKGHLHQGGEILQQNLDLCHASGIADGLVTTLSTLSQARALSGQREEAMRLAEDALREERSTAVSFGRSLRLAQLAEVHLLAGRNPKRGLELAKEALELGQLQGERFGRALAHKALGLANATASPADSARAVADLREALGLAEDMGARPLAAECHLELGRLHRHAGRAAEARAELATAVTLYREMDMRYWLEQAEAEMAALG